MCVQVYTVCATCNLCNVMLCIGPTVSYFKLNRLNVGLVMT